MIKVQCPICQQPMPGQLTDWPQHPFCSKRCRLIDLKRWLNEEYGLPADEDEEAFPDEGELDHPH